MATTDSFNKRGRRRSLPPGARSIEHFQVAEIGNGEVVLFDVERLQYHTLNQPAFAIWRLCDGSHSVDQIAHDLSMRGLHLSADAINLALAELEMAGLLDITERHPDDSLDRRNLLKATVAAGIGGALLPVISSITAPVAAETASECFPSIQCQVNDGQCEPHCQSQGFLFGVCNVLADLDPNNGGCCDCFNEFPGG